MLKKVSIAFVFVLLTIFIHTNLLTHGETEINVLDCIENEKDCEEENPDSVGIMEKNTNNELLEENSFSGGSLAFSFAKMIVALFFVLAIIYIILLLLRRKNKLYQHSKMLENLGGIPLGPNRSVQLIRVGSKVYLVGVGEQIQLITEITEQDVVDSLIEQTEREETSVLQDFLSSRFRKNTEKTKGSNDQFISTLHGELSKLQDNRTELIHKIVEKDDEHV